VTVTNTGDATLRLLDVSMAPGSDPAFSVLPSPGTPQDLAAGANLTYTVRFATPLNTPTGGRTSTLRVTSTALIAGITTVPASATVGRAQSTLAYTGATTADFHDPFTASATLTVAGAPEGGATVSFTLAGNTCTAITTGSGSASCSLTPQQAAGPTTLTASFAGDAATEPSSATVPFTVTREETTVGYTGPGRVANGTAAHLSAVLTEDGSVPVAGRAVTIALGTGAPQQTCAATTDATGAAACTIDRVDQPLNDTATVPVSVTFAGDAYYLPSSAAATVRLEFYTGRAFGLSSQIKLLLLSLTIPPTPNTRPVRTARASSTTTPCTVSVTTLLVTAHALCANVTTTLAPGTSTVTSSVQDITIGIPGVPVIGIRGATATSTSTCTSATGSTTLTLNIGGVPVTVPTAPNSQINLAGGARLIINEQQPVPGADVGLTVNAVHLVVAGGVADLVVASSTSDAHNCH
jgi:hypothetical protein